MVGCWLRPHPWSFANQSRDQMNCSASCLCARIGPRRTQLLPCVYASAVISYLGCFASIKNRCSSPIYWPRACKLTAGQDACPFISGIWLPGGALDELYRPRRHFQPSHKTAVFKAAHSGLGNFALGEGLPQRTHCICSSTGWRSFCYCTIE